MKLSNLDTYEVQIDRNRFKRSAPQPEPTDNDGFLVDSIQGVAKSAGDIGLGLGSIGRKFQRGISQGVDAVFGTNGFGLGGQNVFDEGSQQRAKAEKLLERDTPGEKFGGFLGDVASYALPGGAVVKGSRGLNFLSRAGALGASDGLVTSLQQGGEFDRNSIDSAIIGAVFPLAGAGANVVKRAVLPSVKEAGAKVINSLIKPLLKDFSYGKNPGRAVAEAGITANSLDELGQKIAVVRGDVGREIGEKVAADTTRHNATASFKALDDAIATAQKSPRTNAAIITRLQNLKDDLLQVGEDGIPTRNITDLSSEELFQLKVDVGELTRWTGNATDDEIVNKALRSVYGGLKGQLDESIDGIKPLNEKYADLKSAEIATQYRDKIAARQNLVSFTGQQTGIAAGLITAAATGGLTGGLIVGAGVAGLTEAAKTPAFKTRLAVWLASASKDEIQDAFVQAPWLRGTLQTILFGTPVDEDFQDEGNNNDS